MTSDVEKSTGNTRSFDLDRVKAAAVGQWHSIAQRLTGISSEFLTGRHGPCPKHGGKDKWRVFPDFEQTGGAVCNECGKMGDGFELIQRHTNCSFVEALEKVADCLGIQPSESKPDSERSSTQSADQHLVFQPSIPPAMAKIWCSIHKKPIQPFALESVGARSATYRKVNPVFALPAIGKNGSPVGWALFHSTGKLLPIWEKGNKTPIDHRKIKNTSGSKAGWIGTKIDDSIQTIWKTEGPSDLLALISLGLPKGHAAVCNLFGAGEDPASNPWMLDVFKNRSVIVVHDCDEPGQQGAIEVSNGTSKRPGWAPAIANVAKDVRNLVLPYPVEKTHGKDLRDFILDRLADGLQFAEIMTRLQQLASRADVIAAIAIKAKKSIDGSDYDKESIDDPHRLARINIESYRDKSGGELRYYRNSWFKWRGGKWRQITDSDLKAKVSESIRLQFEADQIVAFDEWLARSDERKGKPPQIQKVTRNVVANTISAMEGMCLVPSSVEMPAWLDDRQSKPFVSFENGLLDYERCFQNDPDSLLSPSHQWFSLSTLPYVFDPSSTCKRWMKFIHEALESDNERIDLLQEWCGYLLLPDTRFQKAMVFEGAGANGKTVALAGITAMLGESNISNLSIEDFANKFALGATIGKLLNISADLGTVDQVAEGTLKQFVGGDRIFVDRKNREPISVRPTAKLMAAWNDRPRIRDRSRGIWRRLIVMPFRLVIDESRAIKGMDSPAYWASEAPGICNWALGGLDRLLRQNRFTRSSVCDDTSAEYRIESSPASMFLSECVEKKDGQSILTKDLYEKFQMWCRENGVSHAPDERILGREVSSMFGIAKRRSSAGSRPRIYDGIALIQGEEFK